MRTQDIPEDVLVVLRECSVDTMTCGAVPAGCVLKLPPRSLDRQLYLSVNKVLECLGGKWNRQAKGHTFAESAEAVKAKYTAAVDTGEYVDQKKAYQFYPTPEPLAKMVIDLAHIESGHAVLEPSAGDGSLLKALGAHSGTVHAVELDPSHYTSLVELKPSNIFGEDFLQFAVYNQEAYDRIVANPPFCDKQDVKHITAMWQCLKPGGRLVSIASSGIVTNEDKLTTALRELIEQHGGFVKHEHSFHSAGTDVNTVIVVMEKPERRKLSLRERLKAMK